MKPLTKREQEVAELIGKDLLTAKEAAHRLGIGVRTVEDHVEHIAAKLAPDDSRRPTRIIIAHFGKAA